MMMVDSGTVRSRASSRSTGILPIGHIALKAAALLLFIRSTICDSNGVSFSYSAISTLWQYDASGWKYSLRDIGFVFRFRIESIVCESAEKLNECYSARAVLWCR